MINKYDVSFYVYEDGFKFEKNRTFFIDTEWITDPTQWIKEQVKAYEKRFKNGEYIMFLKIKVTENASNKMFI